MTKKLVLVALMLLPISAAFADQATYSLSGGSFTLGSSIDVTSATIASPAGTLSLNCPVTSTGFGTYLWQYWCSGGSISMHSSDGLSVLSGTFTSGDLSLTASGGGRGGHVHDYYNFVGTFAGTLSHSGQSEAITGGMDFAIVPLSGQIGSGSAAVAGGTAEVSSVYGPVYVADTYNNQIVRIDSMTGANWAKLGSGQGAGSKQFSNPVGIALDAAQRIYIADTGNCRIVRIDNITGANWTTKGACGTGTGKFNNPAGVAIDSTGKIYIADTGNNQIVRMNDMTGAGWTTLKTDTKGVNKLAGPRSLTFDAGGKIYIADTGNNRVVRVDNMTGAKWTMLSSNNANTFQHYTSVYSIAVDSASRIYVADMYANQIVRVDDMTGANWATLGGPNIGNGVGYFSNPYGMAVDPLSGGIFVADTQNGRIVRNSDMTTLNWSSYGSYGIGVGTFNGPQGIVPVPVPTPVPDAILAPRSLTFSNQNVGAASFAQTLMLTNIGGAPLDIASIATTGDFSLADTCGSSLPGGSDCTLSVTFKPTATGTRTGSLTLHGNSAGATQTAMLSGTGTAPIVATAPASLTFPAQLVSTTSAAQSVTLSNTGTGALTISGISASAGFTQTNNCGSSVAPGIACTLNVAFKPTGSGKVSGTLTVTDNSGTQTVNLVGTGASAAPKVTATPAGVLFPAQALNTKSAAQVITLANHGTASVTISGNAITGDFAKTTTCTTSLAAGHSCNVSVTFTPTATGIRTGLLTFTLSSGPLMVALTGPGAPRGTTEGLTVSPNPLDLGVVSLNDTQTLPVTLTNTNKIVIGIAGIKISGTAYSQNNNCSAALAAGATCTVKVTVNVTTAGTYGGVLTITESAGAVHSTPLSADGTNQ